MQKILTLVATSAALLTGCYVPEGTVRITGGSGESITAENNLGATVLQGTVNLNLQGETTKGFENPTFGRVNIQDLGAGITLQGTVVDFESYPVNFGVQGVAALCVGRGKGPDGEWIPVQFVTVIAQNPVEVPGASKGEGRHALWVETDVDYGASGLFNGGNFVFHGKGGVLAR